RDRRVGVYAGDLGEVVPRVGVVANPLTSSVLGGKGGANTHHSGAPGCKTCSTRSSATVIKRRDVDERDGTGPLSSEAAVNTDVLDPGRAVQRHTTRVVA